MEGSHLLLMSLFAFKNLQHLHLLFLRRREVLGFILGFELEVQGFTLGEG